MIMYKIEFLFIFNSTNSVLMPSYFLGKLCSSKFRAKVQGLADSYHMEYYRKFTALSKAQREKPNCLNNSRTDSSNNTNSLSGFQIAYSSMIKRSYIKSPKPSKAGIFPNVCLFCNKARKRLKNVEQKLVNVKTQNFEKSLKKVCAVDERC